MSIYRDTVFLISSVRRLPASASERVAMALIALLLVGGGSETKRGGLKPSRSARKSLS
jgi:hypothetical protein